MLLKDCLMLLRSDLDWDGKGKATLKLKYGRMLT